MYPEVSGGQVFAFVFFQPCSYVRNASCSELSFTSICEAYTPLNFMNPQNSYTIASYDPARSPVTYTLVSDGLLQYYMDGAYNNGNPRAVNITYQCNSTAATPVILAYGNEQVYWPPNQNFVTLYQMVVQTAAVCGTPFTYVQTCGTSTYDLSSLIGQTLSYYDPSTGFTYWLAPCGLVDAADASGCVGQACVSGGVTLSTYAPSLTQWIPADNGVVAWTQDGVLCGDLGYRTTQIRYICNSSAVVPVIVSAGEQPECRYTIEIATSLVCAITPSHAIGSSFISDLCGAGAYDLTPLSAQDISAVVDSTSYLFINPCGQVKNASCNNLGSSVCYAYAPLVVPPSNDYDLARFDPVHAPITYTVLSNGVQQTHMDGDYCGSTVIVPRMVYISYVCDSTRSVPAVTSYSSGYCVYNITVATSVTCGAAFSIPSNGGSTASVSSVTSTGASSGASAASGGALSTSTSNGLSTGGSGAASTGATGGNSGSKSSGTNSISSSGTGGTGGAVSGGSNVGGGGGGSSLSGGAIAGIVVGGVVAIALLLLLLWCFVCGGLAVWRGKKAGDGFSDVDEQSRRREQVRAENSQVELSQVPHSAGETIDATA